MMSASLRGFGLITVLCAVVSVQGAHDAAVTDEKLGKNGDRETRSFSPLPAASTRKKKRGFCSWLPCFGFGCLASSSSSSAAPAAPAVRAAAATHKMDEPLGNEAVLGDEAPRVSEQLGGEDFCRFAEPAAEKNEKSRRHPVKAPEMRDEEAGSEGGSSEVVRPPPEMRHEEAGSEGGWSEVVRPPASIPRQDPGSAADRSAADGSAPLPPGARDARDVGDAGEAVKKPS